jgi:hypothetical protein
MVWQTRVTTADSKLVAMVTQTQLIFQTGQIPGEAMQHGLLPVTRIVAIAGIPEP